MWLGEKQQKSKKKKMNSLIYKNILLNRIKKYKTILKSIYKVFEVFHKFLLISLARPFSLNYYHICIVCICSKDIYQDIYIWYMCVGVCVYTHIPVEWHSVGRIKVS